MPKSYDRKTSGVNSTLVYEYTDLPPDYYSRYYLSGSHTNTVASTVKREQRTFTGVKTPNWKSLRKANGFIPTTPCTDDVSTSVAIQTEYKNRAYWDNRVSSIEYRNRAPIAMGAPYDFSVVSLAASKLRRKVIDQNFNVGVVLAEAKKTSDMVADTARRIALAIRALRKGDLTTSFKQLGIKNIKKGLRTRKDVYSYWLEMQYGWKPLLQDIDGACKALAQANSPDGLNFHRFETRSLSSKLVTPTVKNDGLTGSVRHEGKAWVIVRVRNDATHAANQLGLLNPLLIAWELVPFSFIADWFVNVGDFIQECTAFTGVDILDSGTSYRMTADGISRNNGYSQPDVGQTRVMHYERKPGLSVMPKLIINENPLSLVRLANSVALLRQVTR